MKSGNLTAMKRSNISESKMVMFWNKSVRKQRCWSDSEGNPVEILYPGRLNDSRGGDFKDALIGYRLGIKKGCIELHTNSSSWRSHGHHRDPFYNQVVLHVVMEQDNCGSTLLENGHSVPTIVLNKSGSKKGEKVPESALPCLKVGRRKKAEYINQVLVKAGDLRFEAALLKFNLTNLPAKAGQELYRGILEALGYSKNKVPFRTLAGFITLNELEEAIGSVRSEEEGVIKLQAVLLGKAGLLAYFCSLTDVSEIYKERLKKAWTAYGGSAAMSVQDWELFKVRPGNYPVRRIAALSQLLFAWREKGCFMNLLELVRKVPLNGAHLSLENAFSAATRDYRTNQIRDSSEGSQGSVCQLGRPRAAEIIINVLLPFFAVWGSNNTDPALSEKVRQIYAAYPRIESNSVERHMLNQLSINVSLIKSARCQQGLIYIYKMLCIQGRCSDCWFSI
jgi:hypothetical protein